MNDMNATSTDAVMSRAELESHDSVSEDPWVAIDGEVFDVSEFLGRHPGGAAILREHAGRDVSIEFGEGPPHAHGARARGMLQDYRVGALEKAQTSRKLFFEDWWWPPARLLMRFIFGVLTGDSAPDPSVSEDGGKTQTQGANANLNRAMYCRFKATDDVCRDIASRCPFGTLVTSARRPRLAADADGEGAAAEGGEGEVGFDVQMDQFPRISHIPMFLEEPSDEFPNGLVWGHVAKNNDQWKSFLFPSSAREGSDGNDRLGAGSGGEVEPAPIVTAVASFRSQHAYVSSRWLSDPMTAVPTWNYEAAVALGDRVEAVVEPAEVYRFLRTLTAIGENTIPESVAGNPFDLDVLPQEYRDSFLDMIVVFRMPIIRWEGTQKLSQNKTASERLCIADGLEECASDEVAALMRAQVKEEQRAEDSIPES